MDFMNVIENTFAQLVGRNACYYAIAAIGLNVQFGYTGLLNFGQAAFMAAARSSAQRSDTSSTTMMTD